MKNRAKREKGLAGLILAQVINLARISTREIPHYSGRKGLHLDEAFDLPVLCCLRPIYMVCRKRKAGKKDESIEYRDLGTQAYKRSYISRKHKKNTIRM